ncbi:carbon-nitrogen hydrolase family protein [Streptomyces sp. SID8379]|uniref:carbon-nitrogen hydrolase family protein n=1 Tax=unclassified Streptomyces TaxID=2593676 RepID=UPI000375467E|nr:MULTISPECIES: carbon-nitrogen hydrolase family protein [unclassified Streptomyces]MYW64204.1 carbon-nitrogen hydrolase family protein [Streptomyces sp. SID8379]
MSRHLRLALVQERAQTLEQFAAGLRLLMKSPNAARLVVYPEAHLYSVGAESLSEQEMYDTHAEPLDGPRGTVLSGLARELGIWLIPGTVLERDTETGDVYNTAVVYGPDGELVARYRKIFTWRPFEPVCAGREFVVFDMPGYGRVGLSICYDSWFPEVSRHLAWLGAELIVNVVQTPTAGRAQEIPVNQANAIVNQVWVASVNGASPTAQGHSLLIDPEGQIQVSAPGMESTTLSSVVDFDRVSAARKFGTCGDSWPWNHFTDGDRPLELPLYNGRIDPATWRPTTPPQTPEGLRPAGPASGAAS